MGSEKNFFFGQEDDRKKEFLICRVERNLFLQLKQKAQNQGISFSDIIREGCRSMLK